MKIRYLFLVLIYVTLQNVIGKSIGKHGRRLSSVDKGLTNGQKTRTTTNDILGKQSEKLNIKYNTNNFKQKSKGGDCTVNCTIIFDNENNNADEGINLMEEEKEKEKEVTSGDQSSKRDEKADSNGADSKESSGEPDEDTMVEADKHLGTENSAATSQPSGIDNKTAPADVNPNLAPKPDATPDATKNKNKQVAVTPQSSVQEGTKSAVSNMSDASQHPSLPIPQMIPLPLFYNSGENEGSAVGQLASDTKNTTQMDEFNGESGYGELFANTSQTQGTKVATLVTAGPSASGKPLDVNNGSSSKRRAGHRVHLHAGKKVQIDAAPQPQQQQQPLVVTPTGDAPAASNFAPHVDNKLASAKPGGGVRKSASAAPVQTRFNVRDDEETTTDYPFVVSDGPKANIHPILNSKIKIGNDHDEDLVDYYDEDEDGEDATTAPAKTTALATAAPSPTDVNGYADNEEESESESGDADTAPKLLDDVTSETSQDVKQGEETSEETSGSGSGNGPAEFSGDTVSNEKLDDKPKKKPGKKIRTKTFEFGVGELGGNNLPIVVPVISKHPKDSEDEKKPANDQDDGKPNEVKDVKKNTKDVTKTLMADAADAGTNDLLKDTEDASKNDLMQDADGAEDSSEELTYEKAKSLLHDTAKAHLGGVAKVQDETESAKPEPAKNVKPEPAKNVKPVLAKNLKPVPAKNMIQEKTKSVMQDAAKNAQIVAKNAKQDAAKGLTKPGREQWIVDMKASAAAAAPLPKQQMAAPDLTIIPNLSLQPIVQVAPKPKVEVNPSGFLYDGVGSRIVSEIDRISGRPAAALPPQAPFRAPMVAGQRECYGLCLTSCNEQCPPGCCRSGFPLANGVTAEILPIPEDLNRVIKDAGLGPGTTAQILPNEQNKHMLQQAGFADGVTARIIPIPAGYTVTSTSPTGTISRSSPAAPATTQILAPAKTKPNVAPQAANLNKESSQPPHPPLAPQAATAAQVPPQPILGPAQTQQRQPTQAFAPPAQALQPPRAAVAPQAPPVTIAQQQAQEAIARDQGLALLPNSQPPILDAAAKAAKVEPPPPPPKIAQAPIAQIQTLPEGEKNYDESVYRELLAQLPPSVAPEQNVLTPLTVTQQLSQLNVPDQMGKQPVRKFFKSVKTQDPYQNLEAYKRQEFKNYDEQFLVDDR